MADEETNDQQVDETDEQSDNTDQAGDGDTGVEGDVTADEDKEDDDAGESDDAGDDDDDEDEESSEVISQKRFDELKKDPEKLFKEMNRGLTKKMQRLAATREALEPYSDFINSYAKDPRVAAIELAESLGIEVKRPKSVEASEKAVEKLSDQINAKVRAALGPEYEDIADKIGTAIHDAASLMVEEAVKPLKQGQESLISESAAREANNALEVFGKTHPDWKKYEKQMTSLSARYKPGEGVSEQEYLDTLYVLASREGKEGDAAKKAAKRINNSAKKSSGKSRSVSPEQVSAKSSGALPTFAESAAAARRGEKLD